MQSRTERIAEVEERLLAAAGSITLLADPRGGDLAQGADAVGILHAFLGSLRHAMRGVPAMYAEMLTRELLLCGARRVSGDIMLDYVLDAILIRENAFSRSAAAGLRDEALVGAMRRDLAAMRLISELDEETVARMIADSLLAAREPDNAAKYASAAWTGVESAAVRQEAKPQRTHYLPPESCWYYGDFELRDAYCADTALEAMYRRFIEAEDWSALVDELWSFHAQNGCGKFLKYRHFYFDGELKLLPDLRAGDFVPLMEGEYIRLYNNASAFLRDESAKPMLLCGGRCMGKTTLMLELTDELPALHLVYVSPSVGSGKIAELLNALRAQPIKFMLLLDELNPSQLAGIVEPMLPMNVLLAACSPVPVLPSLFEVTVELPPLQMNDFARVVSTLLEAEQLSMPQEAVRGACVDYQMDTKCELNMAAAVRVKELLQS